MGCRFEGMEDVLKALQDMKNVANAEVLADAGEFAIEPMLQYARTKAPRRTGALARGLRKEVLDKRPVVKVAMGPHEDQFYGLMIEKGWRPSGRSSKGKGLSLGTYTKGRWKGAEIRGGGWQSMGQVAPRPFMRPAFDTTKDTVLKWFGDYLSNWFDSHVR